MPTGLQQPGERANHVTIRNQEEIVARLRVIRAQHRDALDELFDFRQEVLLEALDLEYAREFLAPAPGGWIQRVDHETYARDYLRFAIGKILHHRGNSASRSVDKLGELAWLIGRDDVVAAMDQAGYLMYGRQRSGRSPTGSAGRSSTSWTATTDRRWPGWPPSNSVTRKAAAGAAPTDHDQQRRRRSLTVKEPARPAIRHPSTNST
jgi:hypothetical protein